MSITADQIAEREIEFLQGIQIQVDDLNEYGKKRHKELTDHLQGRIDRIRESIKPPSDNKSIPSGHSEFGGEFDRKVKVMSVNRGEDR